MAERTHLPSSPACGQWETLLTDALDGLLRPEDEAGFTAHMAACPACAALFEEARKGREWLEFLSPEPETPSDLFEKILARTGPGRAAGLGLLPGHTVPLPQSSVPAWQQPGFFAHVRRFAEPRLLMTAAMAFFSIALTLNLTGIRLTSLRMSDLRPAAIRAYMERRLTTASIPIIRYYDHLRFVYEFESRMRQLRGNAEGQGNQPHDDTQPAAPGESQQAPGRKDGGFRVNPPQQPAAAGSPDYVETSLRTKRTIRAFRRLPNTTTKYKARERSRVWTA